MNAVDRPLDPTPEDPTVVALDIGAGGDDSALLESRGLAIYPFETTSTADSNVLTGWALRRLFDKTPRFVFADVIRYGWAVAGNLRARYKDGEISAARSKPANKPFSPLRPSSKPSDHCAKAASSSAVPWENVDAKKNPKSIEAFGLILRSS